MNYDNVLVTGASGLLGQAIVREMQEKCRVRGFDMRRGEAPIDWHTGDLTDAAAVAEAVKGQDAILQVAAIPNIWSGTGEKTMQVNVVGLYLLLSAAEQAGVRRVVICSSDSVVGYTVREGMMLPPQYLPVDLDHPLQPTDPYGLSKLLGEELGRSFANRGKMEVIVLRPVFVAYPQMYGEIRARAKSPDTYRGTPAGGPSSAGGGPCWHYVDPRDAATAFRLALEMPYAGFARFFVSANNTLAPEPTLERFERLMGRKPEVRRPEHFEMNPFAPLYDLTAAREILGFKAQHDLRSMAFDRQPG
jgi:nucleoside-diphosphate-sugar epimerase